MAAPDPVVVSWFQSVDTNNGGTVDAAELQRALALGGLNYDTTCTGVMIRAFDSSGKGALNLEEFTRLHHFLTSVNQSFYTFDSDRSGQLSTSEVHNALQQAGFKMDPPVLAAALKRHDTSKSGNLHLTEYIQLCLMLQNCHRAFAAFDPQRTGKIALSFNQFVYAFNSV